MNADFDGSGSVDSKDLLEFLKHTGYSSGDPKFASRFDLNNDGAVDDFDLVLLMDTWKKNLAPRTPITPEALRNKLGIFDLEPAEPNDLDHNPETEVYFFDGVTRDSDGDPLQESLPAILAVGAATNEGGGSTFSFLVAQEEGFGPYVAGVSDTGPISIGRFDLVGSAPIDVPTGSMVLEPQHFDLSNPIAFTPPDLVHSGQPTLSQSELGLTVTMDPAKAGYLHLPFLKGATMALSMVVPVTSETTLYDISEAGDWSQILASLRIGVDLPLPGVGKGGPLGTGIQVGSLDALFFYGGAPSYVRTASNIDGKIEERQYRKVQFTNHGCYKGETLEPNNTEGESSIIPVAGIVCIQRAYVYNIPKDNQQDLVDRYTIVPAFDGKLEITCTSHGTNFPVGTRFTLTDGNSVMEDFTLEQPPMGVRVNARILNPIVVRDHPLSLAISVPGLSPEVSRYVLRFRYTTFLTDCVPETEPNNNIPQAQTLADFGCITGSVTPGQDDTDTFLLVTGDSVKTAQILLGYQVYGDPKKDPGFAILRNSNGDEVDSAYLYGSRQIGLYSDLDKDHPLSLQITTGSNSASQVDYSIAYSLTDGGRGPSGECRPESDNNTSQAEAFPLDSPDCVEGILHEPDKKETWFQFVPSESGDFQVLSEVSPEGGFFDGSVEIRPSDPVALPLNSRDLRSPESFFPLSAHLRGGASYFVRFTNNGFLSNNSSATTHTLYRFAPGNCHQESSPSPNSDIATPESFGASSCVSGIVDAAGDSVDHFIYTASNNGLLRFLIPKGSSSPTQSTQVTIYAATETGFPVDSILIDPNVSNVLVTEAAPGSQWIVRLESTSENFDYTVRAFPPATCSPESEGNDSPDFANLITTSACINGDVGVDSGDTIDYFRVRAAASGPLRIALFGRRNGDSDLATINFLDQSLRPIQQTTLYDSGAASFDFGALSGEEILVRIEQGFGPLRYELRVEQP